MGGGRVFQRMMYVTAKTFFQKKSLFQDLTWDGILVPLFSQFSYTTDNLNIHSEPSIKSDLGQPPQFLQCFYMEALLSVVLQIGQHCGAGCARQKWFCQYHLVSTDLHKRHKEFAHTS